MHKITILGPQVWVRALRKRSNLAKLTFEHTTQVSSLIARKEKAQTAEVMGRSVLAKTECRPRELPGHRAALEAHEDAEPLVAHSHQH